jgi:uncharacterized metal-binding protein YceD (DUF177 family)
MTGGKIEFSRPIEVNSLGAREVVRDIAATAKEREALARRLGLHSLAALTARITLRRRGDRAVAVEGAFRAELEQVCVVTLEPVAARIDQSFRETYAQDAAAGAGEVVVLADAEDPPEPLVDGRIDLGEAVVQQLAVALDPYPRKPDAELSAEYAGSSAEEGRSAFASLASLRRH